MLDAKSFQVAVSEGPIKIGQSPASPIQTPFLILDRMRFRL